MTKLHELNQLGQSVWYDNIRRALLDSGELADLIESGVSGITSNPTIFEKAIVGSTDYDKTLRQLADQELDVPAIYERLALEDIGRAADLLLPVYQRTDGADGYISLEVSPTLAYDTEGTVLEARRLFAELARPNLMIKVPATPAGIPAIQTLISEGINVNITLMFGLAQYRQVAEAYLSGLEQRLEKGQSIEHVASVASLFVSRVDTAVDRALARIGAGSAAASDLQGRIAIANARLVYQQFRSTFSGERWQRIADQGGMLQRPLWASTSTKNPSYPDTLYVEALIGADTVDTVPPATLRAFLDHGQVARTVDQQLDQAQQDLQRLAGLGVDLEVILSELLEQGVASFAASFEALMAGIAQKREQLQADWQHVQAELGTLQGPAAAAVEQVQDKQIVPRIWRHDFTVWSPDPDEIVNRLGWLTTAEVMLDNLHRLQALTEGVRADGYDEMVLLGMGGSSLAAQVLAQTFGVREGYLAFHLHDTTDPAALLSLDSELDLSRTLFVVATKSGGTVETLSFFKYFYNRVVEQQGVDRAGPHFLAITDPGSPLVELARQHDFRATLLNDPNIGGRYSALSYFGLAPAALIGTELEPILERARAAACASDSCVNAPDNPAVVLGCAMGEAAKAGRDKLTLICSPAISSFGNWAEQLLAESTGKQGTGILPVVGETLGPPELYGEDRLFVQLNLDGEQSGDEQLRKLTAAGHPLMTIRVHDLHDLGGQFFLWEMATAIAGQRLGIQPFNQPNVEAAKQQAREMVKQYTREGALEREDPSLRADGIELYGPTQAGDLPQALDEFLASAQPGAYLALQAYLQPSEQTGQQLEQLRQALRQRTRLATTLGYGPRYLHSTGQLHKGDAGKGLFIQLTAEDQQDVAIPDRAGESASSITFGVLKAAQAMGDRRALEQAGRAVLRVHLRSGVESGLEQLLAAIGSG